MFVVKSISDLVSYDYTFLKPYQKITIVILSKKTGRITQECGGCKAKACYKSKIKKLNKFPGRDFAHVIDKIIIKVLMTDS